MKTGIIKESDTWWHIIYKNQIWQFGYAPRFKKWIFQKYDVDFDYWWQDWHRSYYVRKEYKWKIIIEKP